MELADYMKWLIITVFLLPCIVLAQDTATERRILELGSADVAKRNAAELELSHMHDVSVSDLDP